MAHQSARDLQSQMQAERAYARLQAALLDGGQLDINLERLQATVADAVSYAEGVHRPRRDSGGPLAVRGLRAVFSSPFLALRRHVARKQHRINRRTGIALSQVTSALVELSRHLSRQRALSLAVLDRLDEIDHRLGRLELTSTAGSESGVVPPTAAGRRNETA